MAAEDAPRPNIVLIMCDDMGWSDIGCYGGEINTPNLDRLAAEGLRFTQFFNCAKCTTTRASLITGLYPRQGHVQGQSPARGKGRNKAKGKSKAKNKAKGKPKDKATDKAKGEPKARAKPNRGLLRPNMVTLAEVLKAAGYQTALSGKWHLGSKKPKRPIDRGFDEYYGLMDGCCNYFDPVQPDPKFKGGRVRTFGHNDRLIKEFPDDYYTTDAFTDHAISTIRRFAKSDQPFFLHLCYTAPHYPLHAKPEDIARYRGKYMKGWDEVRRARLRRQREMGLIPPTWTPPERDPEATSWGDAPHKEWQDLRMAVYAAMIDSMDQNIGRLIDTLKDVGAGENTLVFFLSDNGGCAEKPGGEKPERIPGPREFYTTCGPGWAYAQNTPFRRFKTWMHEGGIATPLVAWWPRMIKPGRITRQVGHIIDFMPTFVELVGTEYPSRHGGQEILPCEGISLVPILEGKTRQGHDTLYWEFTGNRAVREGKWKLAWDKKVRRWELYDLVADRTETRDRAADFPERVKEMSAAWLSWAERTEAKILGKKPERLAGG